jgi:hypothetical protein
MRYAAILILLIARTAAGQLSQPVNPWEPLRWLAGNWTGEETGRAGNGTGERSYRFVMNDAYLLMENTSRFEPQEQNPEGEVHEDLTIFSYDGGRAKLIIRQFNNERFVNTFVSDTVAADGSYFVFLSEHSENAPPGLRARIIYRAVDGDHFVENFDLAKPGKEYVNYLTNFWTRAD